MEEATLQRGLFAMASDSWELPELLVAEDNRRALDREIDIACQLPVREQGVSGVQRCRAALWSQPSQVYSG